MESLISSVIPNFVNGVSQQPYTLRLNSQGSVQENALSTVSQGLKKRQPTKHIKKILNTAVSNAYIHTINRDFSEQYVVIITDGDLKVFNLDGVEQTVQFPEGKAYLDCTDASKDFSAVTVADYTFIVNRGVTVKSASLDTPKRPYEALVNVKLGQYGRTYRLYIDGTQVATYTTPDGSNSSHTASISTDNIASQLYSNYNKSYAGAVTITNTVWSTKQLVRWENVKTTSAFSWLSSGYSRELLTYSEYYAVEFDLPTGITPASVDVFLNGKVTTITAVPGATTNRYRVTVPMVTDKYSVDYTMKTSTHFPFSQPTLEAKSKTGIIAQVSGSVIYMTSDLPFKLTCDDGYNGNSMIVIQGTAQNFSDLPPDARFDGVKVKIAGNPDSRQSDYWVEYDASTNNSKGVWKETVAPGIDVGLFNATMPHSLVRGSDGIFKFTTIPWKYREAGDDLTSKHPSFVDKKIADVFFYRNRLGFLSDESITFSEDGEYFNLYPTTVTTLLDSDRIDVTTAHTKVSDLKHAIGFNKQLLLFSEQTQFLVEDNDTLTPKNISVKVSTEFPCNINAKPVGVGKNVYFVADKDEFSQVREYFPDSNNFNYDSLDVTGHIPRYIPSGVYKMAGAPNEDTLVLMTNREPGSLYVYRFFWSGSDKLQSAWSKFTYGNNVSILNADFVQSTLYLVVSRPDGVYLESMNMALGATDDDEPYYIHLDRKVALGTAALTYNSATGYTIINTTTLGYIPQYGSYKAIIRSGTGYKPGTAIDVIWDGTNAKMLGNWVGASVTIGQVYTFKYTLSPITLRTQSAGGGQKSDTEGRLQIRKVAFNYADTGFFDIKVTPEGRDANTYTFSGKKVGQDSGTIGTYNISTGRFQVPVISRNTTVDISIENSSPLPCSFLSADWEGMYVKRSRAV